MRTTEAWVLHAGPEEAGVPGELSLEAFELPPVGAHDVLVEPLYGSWEGNMGHALARSPIDVCKERGESRVVLGNAGVVRVVEAGPSVTTTKVGDICILFPNSKWDDSGYTMKALAYDAPNTMGALARQSVMHERNVIPIPPRSRFSLRQWAAFSARYVTAWANWRVAYGCWKVQMTDDDIPDAHVWGWGGGTTLGELLLAKQHGFQAAMISSNPARIAQVEGLGLVGVDRRRFPDLAFDEKRFSADAEYRARYLASEKAFLATVKELTGGRGVSIFIDYIGTPVSRATFRALARQGVLTTAGWKHGMTTRTLRAVECIQRHIHVHTHFARYSEGRAAVQAAETSGWLPPLADPSTVYSWDRVPELARDYAADRIADYFPLYQVNAN